MTADPFRKAPDDLRARIESALSEALRRRTNAVQSAELADAVMAALGDLESQWSTVSCGIRYPSLEQAARYRGRNPGHRLEMRLVAVVEDWHAPTNPAAGITNGEVQS